MVSEPVRQVRQLLENISEILKGSSINKFSLLCIHDKHFQYHMIPMEQGMELSMTADTSASYDSVVMTPNKFHPPRRFYFQSTCLDQTTKNFYSGQSSVRNMAWLHYDVLH